MVCCTVCVCVCTHARTSTHSSTTTRFRDISRRSSSASKGTISTSSSVDYYGTIAPVAVVPPGVSPCVAMAAASELAFAPVLAVATPRSPASTAAPDSTVVTLPASAAGAVLASVSALGEAS